MKVAIAKSVFLKTPTEKNLWVWGHPCNWDAGLVYLIEEGYLPEGFRINWHQEIISSRFCPKKITEPSYILEFRGDRVGAIIEEVQP